MSDYRAMFDHKWVKSFDLAGRDVTVTIVKVEAGVVENKAKKDRAPIVWFRGKKPLALNKTNAKQIAELYGKDTKDWIGKAVTLYPTTTSFGGETVDCIRVRNRIPGAKPQEMPNPEPPTDAPPPRCETGTCGACLDCLAVAAAERENGAALWIPVRYHHLKAIGRSPSHGRLVMEREEAQEAEDGTAAMERGTALHAIVFETRRVTYYPGPVRRGAQWDAFQAANTDAEILTGKDYESASRMADAVRAHSDAMQVLTGRREQRIAWKYLGRDCRTTPDCFNVGHVAELKSCRESHPDWFPRAALRLGYHGQLAWQMRAVTEAGLGVPKEAYIVAVESSAPYPVTVFRATERSLEQGDKMVRLWFEKLLGCEASREWPGYVQSIVPFDVPDDDELGLTFEHVDIGEAVEAA